MSSSSIPSGSSVLSSHRTLTDLCYYSRLSHGFHKPLLWSPDRLDQHVCFRRTGLPAIALTDLLTSTPPSVPCRPPQDVASVGPAWLRHLQGRAQGVSQLTAVHGPGERRPPDDRGRDVSSFSPHRARPFGRVTYNSRLTLDTFALAISVARCPLRLDLWASSLRSRCWTSSLTAKGQSSSASGRSLRGVSRSPFSGEPAYFWFSESWPSN